MGIIVVILIVGNEGFGGIDFSSFLDKKSDKMGIRLEDSKVLKDENLFFVIC